ncbi:MAG: hypothetical protein A2X23_11965 [Chloroflexi bacterium GWC2_73_18]|nr:MAG: hypothetical protein A2X23_11965 [Chloroflexi bacterium GWC2_73_18]
MTAEAGARALSGRPAEELTLERLATGELVPGDIRISAETLRAQADLAESRDYGPFAANLRRAAELTALDDAELFHVYEMLRPGRASAAELTELAAWLEAHGAALNAELVRSARDAYVRRGLCR